MKFTLDELHVFITIVETGSLTAASDQLQQPVSYISRQLARLEQKTATTLLRRTTRRIHLTDDGTNFIEDARQILAAVQSAEENLMERKGFLSGRLRIDASTPFMLHVLAPLLSEYRYKYPKIELILSSNEGYIDLLERRVDLAIRIGELKDSTLHSRKLGYTRLILTASPRYLQLRGIPQSIEDLKYHELLGYSEIASLNHWPFKIENGDFLQIAPTLASSNGEIIRHLALLDMGIAYMADFMVADDLENGRLVEVSSNLIHSVSLPISAVFYQDCAVSSKIKSMVNYLAEYLPKHKCI